MNILQERLKDLPDNALMREMQMPTGNAPQFLVLSELKRRKRMRDEYKRQEAADMPTVAEEVVTAAGMPQQGIMGAARAMAPNTNVAQNTGMDMAAPVPATRAPQMMADGGVLRYAPGGTLGSTATAIAMLKTKYPEVYEQYKDDPNALAYAAAQLAESARTPELTGLEELEAPRDYDLFQSLFTDPSNRAVTKKQREIAATQDEREIADQIATQQILRDRADDEGLFAEGSVAEYLRGTPEGGFPRKVTVESTEGSMVSPELDDYLPPSDIKLPPQDMGIRSLSGFGEVPQAPTMDAGFTAPETDFSLEPGSPAETDAIREFLAGGGEQGLRGILDSGLDTTRIKEDDLGALANALTTSDDPIRNLVNRRAQEYLQSDLSTPPEEIYDLGPKGRIKYETEDPAERDRLFAETAQREFLERRAADAVADARIPEGPNMETELRDQRERDLRAEERRMDYLEQPAEEINPIAKALVDAGAAGVEGIGSLFESGVEGVESAVDFVGDKLVGSQADKSSEVVLGEGAEITPQKGPEAVAAQQEIENLRRQVAELSKSGSGGTAGEAAVMKALSARQKAAESDKWMALARTGAAIMASKSPTLGGAVGEGLGVGLESLSKSKKQAQDYEIAMAKVRAAMARSGRAKTLPASALTSARSAVEAAQELVLSATTDPERLAAQRTLDEAIERENALKRIFDASYGVPVANTKGAGGVKNINLTGK
jgi:hypothetical protein